MVVKGGVVSMDIGAKIKTERQSVGLTQEALAEKLKTTRQTVSNWENNRSYPDIVSLIEMSNIFNISIDELIKSDDKMLEYFSKNTNSIKQSSKVKKIIEITVYLFVWVICLIIFQLTNSYIGGAKDDIIMFFIIPLTAFIISAFIGNDTHWKTSKYLFSLFFGAMHLLLNILVSLIQATNYSLIFHYISMNFGTSLTFFLISASVSAFGILIGHLFKIRNYQLGRI